MRITRDPISCIDCGKCTKACPSLLPVDVLRTVKTPECNGCFTCVSVCPVKDTLEMRTILRKRRVPAAAVALGAMVVFLSIVGGARLFGVWNGNVPEAVFLELIPNAARFSHP